MTTKGCACKGSVSIHRECLQEWLLTAENPFHCTVCKSDYDGSFLNTFLTTEDILFCPTKPMDDEEYEDEEEITAMYDFHGIPIIEVDDELIFKNEEHRTIYNQTNNKEHRAIKLEARHVQKHTHQLSKKHMTYSRRPIVHRMRK